MVQRNGLYPDYDVLALQDEWDEKTRKIVLQRLGPFKIELLSKWEQEMIKVIAQHLAYEERDEILSWIVAHIDEQLRSAIGEGQRSPGSPPQKKLVLDGLRDLNHWTKDSFNLEFLKASTSQQFQIISSLQLGQLMPKTEYDTTLQKALFKKLVGLVIEAYYSHPWIWSEIGYGGPAYPRGYVRVELGLTDPWEPKERG